MRLYECSYKHCRRYTKAVFSGLTLSSGSSMSRVISELHNGQRSDARVVYAKVDNAILGWALLVDPAVWRYGGTEVHFYVATFARRQGIGTLLMRKARKQWGIKFKVCPHDELSRSFFNHVQQTEKLAT